MKLLKVLVASSFFGMIVVFVLYRSGIVSLKAGEPEKNQMNTIMSNSNFISVIDTPIQRKSAISDSIAINKKVDRLMDSILKSGFAQPVMSYSSKSGRLILPRDNWKKDSINIRKKIMDSLVSKAIRENSLQKTDASGIKKTNK